MLWLVMAICSAVLAGVTSILAKCGIKHTDSDVATMLRTIVVLVFAWVMVFIVGSAKSITTISGKSLLFLVLSGIATGASWLCYFKALSIGDVNKVVPIDKSSTILSVLLAIVLFGETNHLWVKLACTVVLGVGIYLMVERKHYSQKATIAATELTKTETDYEEKTNARRLAPHKAWIIYAVLSAVFAAATSILAKVGITNVESNLGTAIRTGVVLVMAFLVLVVKKKLPLIRQTNRKELGLIGLSGLATGGSWLCYYYAIQTGVVSVVVPIDKLSILVTIGFSTIFLKEKLSKKAVIGLLLMVAATVAMAVWGR